MTQTTHQPRDLNTTELAQIYHYGHPYGRTTWGDKLWAAVGEDPAQYRAALDAGRKAGPPDYLR